METVRQGRPCGFRIVLTALRITARILQQFIPQLEVLMFQCLPLAFKFGKAPICLTHFFRVVRNTLFRETSQGIPCRLQVYA